MLSLECFRVKDGGASALADAQLDLKGTMISVKGGYILGQLTERHMRRRESSAAARGRMIGTSEQCTACQKLQGSYHHTQSS